MTTLAAKLPTTIFGCDQDLTVTEFHARYVDLGGSYFLYGVRKVTVKEAYQILPGTYDQTVRCANVPPGTQFYWFAAEYSEVPI